MKMKTAREWFLENLNEEQIERVVELMGHQGKLDRLDDVHPSFRDALNRSFAWSDTPQNEDNWEEHDYWNNIHNGRTPDVMPWKKNGQLEELPEK